MLELIVGSIAVLVGLLLLTQGSQYLLNLYDRTSAGRVRRLAGAGAGLLLATSILVGLAIVGSAFVLRVGGEPCETPACRHE